jgi:hypothetical protein
MSQAIDILTYAHELKEAGVPPRQAEIHATKLAIVIDHHSQMTATKEDLKLIDVSIKKEMKELEIKMIATFASLLALSVTILGVLIKFH